MIADLLKAYELHIQDTNDTCSSHCDTDDDDDDDDDDDRLTFESRSAIDLDD